MVAAATCDEEGAECTAASAAGCWLAGAVSAGCCMLCEEPGAGATGTKLSMERELLKLVGVLRETEGVLNVELSAGCACNTCMAMHHRLLLLYNTGL